MLINRLPVLKEHTDIKDIYVDGSYYSEDVEKESRQHEVTVHYTDMTGKTLKP